jgi:hypothetical protein
MTALEKSNVVCAPAGFSRNAETTWRPDVFKRCEGSGGLVVHVSTGDPSIEDWPISRRSRRSTNYVFMGMGPNAAEKGLTGHPPGQYEAVTIAMAKTKRATRALFAVGRVEKSGGAEKTPDSTGCQVTVTRNYGETPKKSPMNYYITSHRTFSVNILNALF